MQYPRDLSLIGTKINLSQMKRRLAKHLFDALELALQDLRYARENENILDGNHGEPHSLSAHKPCAFRNVGHTQIRVDNVGLIILPQRGFKIGESPESMHKSCRNSVHREIIVSRANSTCGK